MTNAHDLFKINREAGKLLLNSPLVLKIKSNGSGSIVDYYDDSISYSDLMMIPLRLDETKDPYTDQTCGLLLAIATNGNKLQVKGDRKQNNPITPGTTIYLFLRRGKSGKGPLDSFIAMANRVEIESGRRIQGWVWMPNLVSTTSSLGEYAKCQWLVSEPEKKELDLLPQVAERAGSNFCFEGIWPVQNAIAAKFDETYIAVKQEQQQKLAAAQPAVPQSQPQLQPAAQ